MISAVIRLISVIFVHCSVVGGCLVSVDGKLGVCGEGYTEGNRCICNPGRKRS